MTRTQSILNKIVKSMRLKQFNSPMEAYDQAVQDYDHKQGKKHTFEIDATYCSNNIKK